MKNDFNKKKLIDTTRVNISYYKIKYFNTYLSLDFYFFSFNSSYCQLLFFVYLHRDFINLLNKMFGWTFQFIF